MTSTRRTRLRVAGDTGDESVAAIFMEKNSNFRCRAVGY
jgi:hypothetical protein